MYYPPVFTPVRPFDPRANPLEVSVGRENPLDLSVKQIRPTSDTGVAEDLLMLDHRKLANLAASHSLSAMGRQLLDPTLFRLNYGTDAAAAAMLPGLTPPFCYDRTTGVAVPTSLAGHQIMSNYLQQRERLEHQHQQAMYAARTSAVAQQQAAVAAAAVAYMDPANLPLHLRNGLTQREAAAALAATRGLYAPTLPAPMVLPAFSLYTDDKGAFTSLRNSSRDNAPEKSFLNGTSAASTPVLDAARYAEHFHRLRDLHQHQPTGKCNNACCTSNAITGLGQSSVPCACCVQTPSQAALCARSPMGCATKDPTAAATGKVCDYVQPSLSFLHRPTATTVTTTTSSSSSEIRLSVSSLCSTQTTSEPTTVSSSRDKHQTSSFRPSTIWNAGLPTVTTTPTTSSTNKTAFSVPKRKEMSSKDHHKEHKTSGSIKDILKDNHNNASSSVSFETSKYDTYSKVNTSIPPTKSDNSKRSHEKSNTIFMNEDYPSRYYPRESSEVNPFVFHRGSAVVPPKNTTSNLVFNNTNSITTTVASVPTVVPSKIESGSVPVSKMPPLLEAVRPTEPKVSLEVPQETPTTIPSPQGPPPLIAVSNTSDHLSSVTSHRSLYPVTDNALRMPTSIYPTNTLLLPPYKHSVEKSTPETSTSVKVSSSSSKSPKKSTPTSQSYPKFNGLSSNFGGEEPPSVPLSLPKPIPQLPTHHLAPTSAAHPYSSHYRPGQHQLNLQNHNGWIPAANPNVTVAPLPQPATTTTTIATTSTTSVVTTSHQTVKPQQTNFTPIKREPDYADTANVLQSLLIRPAPGLEPLATIPPSTATGIATSVVTPTNNLPLFGLDYRYPFPHQLLLNRDGLPAAPLNCVPSTQINGSSMSSVQRDIKPEITKIDSSNHSSVPIFSKNSSKKRPNIQNCADESASSKKRLLTSEFAAAHNQPKYTFQPSTYANEAAEATECPYTFIPEPPLNFSGQFKTEDIPKPVRKDVIVERPVDVPEAILAPSKSPVIVPAKLSPLPDSTCVPELPASNQITDRVKAFRAKRRLRKKLLARIYQQRRPLFNGTIVQPDPSVIERQLAVRYTRKLLSQLTLRWAHRRYVHKWHSMKRKSMTKILKLKKKRKDGKLVYKIKKETKTNKKSILQEEPTTKVSDTVSIPSEMKKLMVNKALGETTLHRAARLGYPEAVAYCLKTKCVSVNARDNAGYTPLHECCSRGHLDIARALLQYGADVNASAAGGIRPLHDAVENDHVEIVRLLLSYGADPTIATYSGLEPMKLARSPMMAEFLQGFFADISGEVDSRPHLPWRFWGSAKCLDPEDCGYDVFDGVPSDPPCEGGADNDFLFEVSDSPHLPTFRLLLPVANTKAQCNYLRLNDVLRKLCMSKEDFLQTYSHIDVLTVPSHEFEASAMCSPLLTGTKLEAPLVFRPCSTERIMDNGCITDLVRLDNSIRQVLGIETISVR